MDFSKTIIRRLAPAAAALVVFFVVSAAYFAPQFRGEVLPQHDVVQYEGMAKDISDMRAATGEDPQWTGGMFGGMPAFLINVAYPAQIVKRTVGQVVKLIDTPAAFLFFAMTAMWLMLLVFGVDPWVGIVPALAYGLSTYFLLIIGAGHITKMWALVYAPLMMGGAWMTLRGNMWAGGALTALTASLEIGANHPQITYYFLLAMSAFWISEGIAAFREKHLGDFWKRTAVLAAAGILAAGSNFSPLWYTASHSKETMRGGSELASTSETSQDGLTLDYATAWSYGRTESLNLLIPDFMGRESATTFSPDGEVAAVLNEYGLRGAAQQLPAYWGSQPYTGGPTYLGAATIFLAALGIALARGRNKWWIIAACVVMILLAWGRNLMGFTEFAFKYLPGYNKFRTVSMILVIAEWSVPFLMAVVLQRLWCGELDRQRLMKGLRSAVLTVGGIALLFLVFGGALMSFSGQGEDQLPQEVASAMRSERASMMRADAFRSLLFVLLAAGVVWAFAAEKIKKTAFVLLLGVLVTADMVPVNLRYLNGDTFVLPNRAEIRPTEADRQILADSTGEPGYRVLNLSVSTFNDASTSYFHRSVGGYHGAKLHRYQDLIDRHLSKMNMNVYNMLNTRYVIVPDQQTGRLSVQHNPEANGAAWFVDSVAFVETPDLEIDALTTTDTKRVAVVDERFADALQGVVPAADSTASIRMTEYRVNLQRYEYTAPAEGVAVFSEIYYPHGWTAYVDGEEAPYFRADYVLRAMALPAGNHTVEFRFRAPHYAALTAVTRACSLLLLAGLVAAVSVAAVRKRKQTENS